MIGALSAISSSIACYNQNVFENYKDTEDLRKSKTAIQRHMFMYVHIKNRDTFIVMVGCGFKSDWTYPKPKRKKIKITYFNPL